MGIVAGQSVSAWADLIFLYFLIGRSGSGEKRKTKTKNSPKSKSNCQIHLAPGDRRYHLTPIALRPEHDRPLTSRNALLLHRHPPHKLPLT
jgi:hypothetical protein